MASNYLISLENTDNSGGVFKQKWTYYNHVGIQNATDKKYQKLSSFITGTHLIRGKNGKRQWLWQNSKVPKGSTVYYGTLHFFLNGFVG